MKKLLFAVLALIILAQVPIPDPNSPFPPRFGAPWPHCYPCSKN